MDHYLGLCGPLPGVMWTNHFGPCKPLIWTHSFFLQMVRSYKRKRPDAAPNYSEKDMARAIVAVNEGASFVQVAKTYEVPKTTLIRRYKGKIRSPYKFGHKCALLRNEEFAIAQNLAALGDFGMAFDGEKLREFVKEYLDSKARQVDVFKDNRPGVDWLSGFLKRNKNILTTRICQNSSQCTMLEK